MAFYKCDKKQNSGTGFKVDDVSNFTAVADSSDAKVTLSWTDPDDFEIEGTVQAKWAGTVIVRKAYSEPKSTGDGTIVLNSTVKNQYSVNGFEDENVYLSTTYYYRAFPYTTDGVTTVGTSVSVETAAAPIYGAEWDGTASSAWTRTDSAQDFVDPVAAINNGNGSSPFDNIMPWSGMQRVEDAEAGTLVSIPKYYYKWTRSETSMKLQISSVPIDGFLTSPAHADRGDGKGERDVVYVGAYKCNETNYKSTTNSIPRNDSSASKARPYVHNLGDSIWISDYAMYWTIWMLYLVEYADWNSQARIGWGGGQATLTSRFDNSGLCDSMTYHTGTNAIARSATGTGLKRSDSTDMGHVRYRYIEDLWVNGYESTEGLYCEYDGDDTYIYCEKNPSTFGDYNGTLVGSRSNVSTNVLYTIKAWTNPTVSGFEYALFPSEEEYNAVNSYVCDSFESGNKYSTGSRRQVLLGFPTFYQYDLAGEWRGLGLFGISTDSDNHPTIRLMKLP